MTQTKNQLLVFVGNEMKEKLTHVLELLRNGYVQQAYEIIKEILDEI